VKTKRMAGPAYQLTCSAQEIAILRALLDMAKRDYEVSGPKDSQFLPSITRMGEQLHKMVAAA
jgi:hypothetical protein